MPVFRLTIDIETEVEAEVERLAERLSNEADACVEPVKVIDWTIDERPARTPGSWMVGQ